MFLPLILISVLGVIKRKDLRVNNGVDLGQVNCSIHFHKLLLRSNKNTSHYADIVQGIHQRWLLVAISRSQESNNSDKTLKLDSLE
jgi:hypothetical protein